MDFELMSQINFSKAISLSQCNVFFHCVQDRLATEAILFILARLNSGKSFKIADCAKAARTQGKSA
jgi:hypothetical protein